MLLVYSILEPGALCGVTLTLRNTDAGDKAQKPNALQPLCMIPSLGCHPNNMPTGVVTTRPIPVK